MKITAKYLSFVKKEWPYLLVGSLLFAMGLIFALSLRSGANKVTDPESVAEVAGVEVAKTAPDSAKPLVEDADTAAEAPAKVTPSKAVTKELGKVAKSESVTLAISSLGSYQLEINGTESAFLVLNKAAAKYDFSIGYQQYSFGKMITRIGAAKAEGTSYWALYYNGSYATKGAEELMLKDGDKVEWRYESWQ